MKKRETKNKAAPGRLLKIGNIKVADALGFFWHDKNAIYVAHTPSDIAKWMARAESRCKLYPMSKIEEAFKMSHALRFISWCSAGGIVKQGAGRVTFVYDTHKSTLHIK